MILADRILDTLRANGPIAAGEFPKWFGDIERMDLDAEVSRLLRKSAISFSFNKYDLIEQKAASWHAPFVSQAVSEPVRQLGCDRDAVPSAAEEVAASLKPAVPITRERYECLRCHNPRFDAEFRRGDSGMRSRICRYCQDTNNLLVAPTEEGKKLLKQPAVAEKELLEAYCLACDSTKPVGAFQRNKYGKVYKRCIECSQEAVSVGMRAAKQRANGMAKNELKGPEGECPQAPLPAQGTTSEPVVTEPQGNAGESLPSNSVHACGEAQRPRTAGPCRMEGPAANTSTEASAVSPRTSLDKQPPAPADIGAGQRDEFLKRVAAKLIELQAARDEITCEMDELVQLEVLYRDVMGEGT